MTRKIIGFDEIFNLKGMPSVLYHYTSLNGFKGIIESKNLWATDFRYLNDIDEVRHIFKDIVPKLPGWKNNKDNFLIPDIG